MAWQQRRPATYAAARPPPPPVPTSHATTIVVDPDSARHSPLLTDDKIKEAQGSPKERNNYGKSKAGDANSDEEGDTSGEDESNDDEV
uniref:Uncharacterized protein n=1 Tax=Oryza rufipogon TaxID=4529 RepID=A0A0E0R550_ORYRU